VAAWRREPAGAARGGRPKARARKRTKLKLRGRGGGARAGAAGRAREGVRGAWVRAESGGAGEARRAAPRERTEHVPRHVVLRRDEGKGRHGALSSLLRFDTAQKGGMPCCPCLKVAAKKRDACPFWFLSRHTHTGEPATGQVLTTDGETGGAEKPQGKMAFGHPHV